MLGDVRHCFGGPGELTGTLYATGHHVAPRCVVEIACGIEVKPGVGGRSNIIGRADSLVGAVEVATSALVDVFGARVVRRKRQIGVLAIEPGRIAGMVDGAGQVVRRGSDFASAAKLPCSLVRMARR